MEFVALVCKEAEISALGFPLAARVCVAPHSELARILVILEPVTPEEES